MDWRYHRPICWVSYLLWTWTFRIGRTNMALRLGQLPAVSYRIRDGAQTPQSHPLPTIEQDSALCCVVLLLLKLWV